MKWQSKTAGNTIFHCLGRGGGGCGTNWSTDVVEIATLYEFDEINRLFTTSCRSYMGHILRIYFSHILSKKGIKGWILRKMPRLRIKPDKILKN
jgi:hypothetical protein